MCEVETVTINIKSSVTLGSGLTMSLRGFSHKHPMPGGPTKAMACVTMALPKDGLQEDIELSIHGIEGDPSVETYDKKKWRDYDLELMPPFNYDASITVKVSSPLLKERLQ